MNEQAVVPAGQKRSRWRLVILLSVVTCAITAALLIGIQRYQEAQEKGVVDEALADLRAAIAEVDRAEPGGWQMEDIERQREKIPDAENGAEVVLAAAKLLPRDWKDEVLSEALDSTGPPVRLAAAHADRLQQLLRKLEPARKEARKLLGYPKGRFPPPAMTRDYFSLPTTYVDSARNIVTLLYADVVGHCEQGGSAQAWASAVGVLHAGRAIGDDPLLLAQLVRIAGRGNAVEAMERILAHGEVKEEALADARARLRSEQGSHLTAYGLRGERAGQHVFYTNLAKGAITLPALEKMVPVGQLAENWERRKAHAIPTSHAYMLRTLTRAVGCAEKNGKGRDDCFADWEVAIKDAKGKLTIPLLAGLLTPAVHQIGYAETRSDSLLGCAVTALAAEQFRLRAKRWPKDLAEVVKAELLPKVPEDFDGKPLRLRHAPDGLVIYSLVANREYEGTAWDNLQEPPLLLERVEFRLWDPAHRRQPAPPPPPPDEPEA